ncbi:MAG: hypothetical protein KGD72_05880 [Candidatus Lokiarchaeota archaeon]|nr:hypothetical protein [Candidatus Lokiarchaeota archaeon]
MVFHDKKLARTTNGKGVIKKITYNDLKNLKTKYRNRKIPLLGEFIDYVKNKAQMIIHLKNERTMREVLS